MYNIFQVKFKTLSFLLKLIYTGEVDLDQDDLEDFVKTADELKIIGLTDNVSVKKMTSNFIQLTNKVKDKPLTVEGNVENHTKQNKESSLKETVKQVSPIIRNENDDNEMIRKDLINEDSLFSCDTCDYNTVLEANMAEHKFIVHSLTKMKTFSCDECSFSCFSNAGLYGHTKRSHTFRNTINTTMFCQKFCGSQYKNRDALKRHKMVCTTVSNI